MGMLMVIEPTSRLEKRHRIRRRQKAIAWRDETIAKLFSEIKRQRPLEEHEKEQFDRALAGLGPKRDVWRWSEKENRRLILFIRQRQKNGRPAPFTPNNEVYEIAVEMGRTYMAVHRQIERLRKQMKCSDAQAKRKG